MPENEGPSFALSGQHETLLSSLTFMTAIHQLCTVLLDARSMFRPSGYTQSSATERMLPSHALLHQPVLAPQNPTLRLDSGALCQLAGNGALALLLLVLGLGAQDVAAPLHAGALVVLGLERLSQLGELTLVLWGTNKSHPRRCQKM